MDNLFSMMELVSGDTRGLDFSVCSPRSEIPYTVDYLSSLLLASWSELYELGVAGVSSQDSSGGLKEKIYNNCVMAK